MSDVYILLKDLADTKAGTKYRLTGETDIWYHYDRADGRGSLLHKMHVENNPEWFEKEDKIESLDSPRFREKMIRALKDNQEFWKLFFDLQKNIKDEPQSVEERAYTENPVMQRAMKHSDLKTGFCYTIEQMEECFKQAREMRNNWDAIDTYKHKSFTDYINIKK